jgi:hypothetical protein
MRLFSSQLALFVKYNKKEKEEEMGRTCSKREGGVAFLRENPDGKRLQGKTGLRWENYI